MPDSYTRIIDGGAVSSTSAIIPLVQQQEYMVLECVSSKNVFGESLVWFDCDQSLCWISAPEEEVWMWNMKDPPYCHFFGIATFCVVLRDGEEGLWVIAGER